MTRRTGNLAGLTVLVALALAACGEAGNGASSVAVPAVATQAQGAGAAPASFSGTQGGITVGSANGQIERSVTAAYTVPQGSFLQAFQQVTARAAQLGGYIVSSQTSPDSSGRIVTGSLTVKIPAQQIAAFINGFPSTYQASSINFGSVDHTADFIDVNARLASANAHLSALQALLAKAQSLDDITSLEQQIESVQQEIDTDQGQLNLLTNQVDYATATIRLSERGAAPAAPQPPVTNGVVSGWNNALAVTSALAEGLITVSPMLLLAAVALLVWWRVAAVRRPSPSARIDR